MISFKKIWPPGENRLHRAKRFFVSFYLIGVAGFLIPPLFPLFKLLVPFALLLSFAGLILFRSHSFPLKLTLIFLFIYIAGFWIEVAGVQTGLLFGHYQYGRSLGLKLFETPLLIGLNWVLLVYLSASVLDNFRIPAFLKITGASGIMLGYDIVLEQAAPLIDMWSWEGGEIPLQNYLAWFILALCFHFLLYRSRVRLKNPLAVIILLCQVGFFLILFLLKPLLP